MTAWRWWATGVASLGAAIGVVATGSVVALAQRFVDELSRPGATLDEAALGSGWMVPQAVPEPPAERRRSLSFQVPGGPLLRGEFWAQAEPAPTIVICHGYRVSRAALRPVAALEYQHGFNTLLFDFRGHGESAPIATSGGNAEVHDLDAALDIAAQQPETLPGTIYIHGFSMGAAVALLAPPRADVAGIIADSPYARLDDILRRLVTWQLTTESAGWTAPLRWLRGGIPALARVACAASDPIFRLRHRHPLLARPEARLRSWARRGRRAWRPRDPSRGRGAGLGRALQSARRAPLLLIHALRDPFIPVDHAWRIALAAHASHIPLDVYFADSAIHCGAYAEDPDRYIAVLRRFIARASAARDASARDSERPTASPVVRG
jgi:alpha-beta hydrolase superfamily lysophospholipase